MSRTGYTLADIADTGAAVKKIVNNIIDERINAPFLARVAAVTGNTVTVTPIDILSFNSIPIPPAPLYDVTVGMPYTGKSQTTMPIQIGDVGLCIVTNRDLSAYKSTGMESQPPTARRFNKTDSIFIPLSMQKQDSISLDYVFKYLGAPMLETLSITISSQNTISVVGGQGGSAFTMDIADDGSFTYDIANGSITVDLSASGTSTFSDVNGNVITVDNTGIVVTDMNGNSVEMTNNGVIVSDLNQNTIETNSSGTTITDANQNSIAMSSSGVSVTDAAGNKIDLTASGVAVADSAGNKVDLTPAGVALTAASGSKIDIGAAGVTINNGALMVMP